MKGKVFVLISLVVMLGASLYAKSNVEEKNVTNLEIWVENFDLSGKKAGKYNIVVTATDTGGNTSVAGPLNVFVDPDSDLPTCGITNPFTGMVTGSNLNVVGTCVDDDAVASVELVFDGDTEHPIVAEGKDFWSYYLNTTDLSEGKHTISAVGVDINGLRGKPRTVTWELNRHSPQTALTSHVMGTLVSGKQKLSGTVEDGSGIKDLSYSVDQGKTFIPVQLSINKKTHECKFEFLLDTKKLPDGPQVIWFRAHDLLNTQGMYSFLLYVDNTVPEVKIVSPTESDQINGIFAVTGYAKDTVGISALSWTCGKQTGNLELIPGNPFFTFNCDIRGETGKNVSIIISATDTAGNTTTSVRKQPVNQEADKPTVTIFSPAANGVIGDQLTLLGSSSDDDGVAEIDYYLDSQTNAIQTVPTEGVFADDMTARFGSLAAGAHSITIWAKDINGIEGNRSIIKFTAPGDKPAFGPISVVAAADPDPVAKIEKIRAYSPSMEIHPESATSIKSTLTSSCGIQSVTWQFTGEDLQTMTLKKAENSVPLSIPMTTKRWGNTCLTINAVDIYGRTTSCTTQYFLTDLGLPRGDNAEELAASTTNSDAITFVSVGDQPYTVGMQAIAPSKLIAEISCAAAPTVTYSINGGINGKAKVTGSGDSYTAEISLDKLPARLAQIKVTVSAKKVSPFEATAFVYIIRDKATVTTVEDSEKFYWIDAEKDRYELTKDQSVTGIANFAQPLTVEFASSVDAATRAMLSVSAEGNCITITPQAEGLFEKVAVDVTDGNGVHHKSNPITILADYSAPTITFNTPTQQAWLQNKLSTTFAIHDDAWINKTEYAIYSGNASPENIQWKDAASGKSNGLKDTSYNINLSLDGIEDGPVVLAVRATDATGKQSVSSVIVFKDTKAPEISVLVPEDGMTVNGETRLVLSVKDNGKIASSAYVANSSELPIDNNIIATTLVGTQDQPILDSMKLRFIDKAGNSTTKNNWNFKIDAESDLPVAQIHVPEENEVITKDFVVSGVVYDDDGNCTVSYKLDNGDYIKLDGNGSSFSIPIALSSMTDNEHSVTVRAEDIHGVKGHEVVRKFRISLEEPKASFTSPTVSETVKDLVTITGTASDKNGIAKVSLSFDNGNSYVQAEGTTSWSLTFDSHVIQDGTHCVFLKVTDGYGIEGMYSSLVNIDNTVPNIYLDLPRDGSKTSGMVFFTGQATDNIGLKKLYYTVRALGSSAQEKKQELSIENIITGSLDLSDMKDGIYNIEITGEDAGGNLTRISRNIEPGKSFKDAKVRILYPMDGDTEHGHFNIYGNVDSEKKVNKITLIIDGKESDTTVLSESGYYKFSFLSDDFESGTHKIMVRAEIEGSSAVSSLEQVLNYVPEGPWITVDNFTMGDFSFNRAYLKGEAGYELSESDHDKLADKKTPKAEKEAIKAKEVESIELSFDNGKTFITVSKKNDWKYRIEDSYIAEGYHFMVLRATMRNGERAIARFIIQIDKTNPTIKLISPGEGGRYNQTLDFSGLSSDDIKLSSVTLALRKGDKSLYAVPGFLQGAYLDVHCLGATLYDVGAGLSFFDDNVKLQVQFGQMTDAMYALASSNPKRYGGNVYGAKLIANIYKLPFASFLGPDWEWLSATFSLGAGFSLFSETQSGKSQMLSAVLVQTEFPRATIPNWKRFRTWSLYEEFQLWFAPSDRNSDTIDIPTFIPEFCFGIRTYVF